MPLNPLPLFCPSLIKFYFIFKIVIYLAVLGLPVCQPLDQYLSADWSAPSSAWLAPVSQLISFFMFASSSFKLTILQYCCLENPMDRGASWVEKNQAQLKWLSTYILECINLKPDFLIYPNMVTHLILVFNPSMSLELGSSISPGLVWHILRWVKFLF